jgi:hypothetical protein
MASPERVSPSRTFLQNITQRICSPAVKKNLLITTLALEILLGSVALLYAFLYAFPSLLMVGICFSAAAATFFGGPKVKSIGLEILVGSVALYFSLPSAPWIAAGLYTLAAATIIVGHWPHHSTTPTSRPTVPTPTAARFPVAATPQTRAPIHAVPDTGAKSTAATPPTDDRSTSLQLETALHRLEELTGIPTQTMQGWITALREHLNP